MAVKSKKQKIQRESRIILACDVSMNGSAIVVMDINSTVLDWFLFTQKVGISKRYPNNTKLCKDLRGLHRILESKRYFEPLLYRFSPHYIVFEDYAFGKVKVGMVFSIGEFTGGAFKLPAYAYAQAKGNVHIRTYSPSKVKMWGTGKGTADKKMMVDAAKEHKQCDIPLVELGDNDDLADAFWTGNLFCHELKLRDGQTTVEKLKERWPNRARAFGHTRKRKEPPPHEMAWVE